MRIFFPQEGNNIKITEFLFIGKWIKVENEKRKTITITKN